MPTHHNTEEQISIAFNALAHPRRVRIFRALQRFGILSFEDIAAITKIPAPSLTHHIRVLKRAGFVLSKPRGSYTDFRLDQAQFQMWFGAPSYLSKEPRPLAA
ncbi:MAG: winged helix-turn-helix domain-containing protein [Pseudomonadota bacterium]